MYIGDIEITKREITFSTIIIAIMIGLGFLISNPIIKAATEEALRISSSIQVRDSLKFDYARRTNVGDFIAEGKLYTLDTLSIPDIDGKYSYIEKIKQKYTMHVQHYTTSDGKGHVHHHTRTYWSWDTVHRDEWKSERYSFLGHTFTPEEIKYRRPSPDYHSTIKESHDIRYQYYVCGLDDYGIITGIADDKAFNKIVFKRSTIDKVIESANSDMKVAPIIFWVDWIMLICVAVFAFVSFENYWLY